MESIGLNSREKRVIPQCAQAKRKDAGKHGRTPLKWVAVCSLLFSLGPLFGPFHS